MEKKYSVIAKLQSPSVPSMYVHYGDNKIIATKKGGNTFPNSKRKNL